MPLSETKFRGKKHPEDPEDPEDPEEVQNVVRPSDLYDRFSTSIEIKSDPESSVGRPGPAENASDRELVIGIETYRRPSNLDRPRGI
jgi:hypothetical protein